MNLMAYATKVRLLETHKVESHAESKMVALNQCVQHFLFFKFHYIISLICFEFA